MRAGNLPQEGENVSWKWEVRQQARKLQDLLMQGTTCRNEVNRHLFSLVRKEYIPRSSMGECGVKTQGRRCCWWVSPLCPAPWLGKKRSCSKEQPPDRFALIFLPDVLPVDVTPQSVQPRFRSSRFGFPGMESLSVKPSGPVQSSWHTDMRRVKTPRYSSHKERIKRVVWSASVFVWFRSTILKQISQLMPLTAFWFVSKNNSQCMSNSLRIKFSGVIHFRSARIVPMGSKSRGSD